MYFQYEIVKSTTTDEPKTTPAQPYRADCNRGATNPAITSVNFTGNKRLVRTLFQVRWNSVCVNWRFYGLVSGIRRANTAREHCDEIAPPQCREFYQPNAPEQVCSVIGFGSLTYDGWYRARLRPCPLHDWGDRICFQGCLPIVLEIAFSHTKWAPDVLGPSTNCARFL